MKTKISRSANDDEARELTFKQTNKSSGSMIDIIVYICLRNREKGKF
jgi:hypothetical protein